MARKKSDRNKTPIHLMVEKDLFEALETKAREEGFGRYEIRQYIIGLIKQKLKWKQNIKN